MKTQEKNKYIYLKPRKSKKSKNSKKNWNGIPAVIKKYEPEFSLSKHFRNSAVGHIIGILLTVLVSSLLAFWGINNIIFPKPKQKMPDIEFVLADKSHSSSRHKKSASKVSMNSLTATPQQKLKEPTITEPKTKNKTTKNIVKPKKSSNSFAKIPDDFSMPMPKIGPSSSTSGSSRRKAGASSGSESFTPTVGIGGGNSSSKGQNAGNGNGFDKNGTRKLVAAYDISPYVNELKRNVRLNWRHPQNSENKNVELFLRIAKDGKIIILNVKRTSENAETDNAALNAVRRSEPLSPLPSKYPKGYLDVVFTFDGGISSVRSRY